MLISATLTSLGNYKFYNDYFKIDNDHLDNYEIEKIRDTINLILRKNENLDVYHIINNQKSNSLIRFLNKLHQQKLTQKRKVNFGIYEDVIFNSFYQSKSGHNYKFKIFRYKGVYDSKKDVEIRVYTNKENNIVRINVLNWKEDLF